MKTAKLLCLWALVGAAAALPAQGLYVLGGLGDKDVYPQDFNDFYGSGSIYDGYDMNLADAAVSLGYRFPGFMAVEAMVGIDQGREGSGYIGGAYSSNGVPIQSSEIQVQPMTTLAIGPVFCWDRPSWWFAESGTTEFGLRLEYASLSGSETAVGVNGETGSQDFNASTLGFGVFVRALNIWETTGINLGLELGYDFDYFGPLPLSNTNGILAGNNGQNLENYSGANGGQAYIDNEGGYIRLVFGWSQPTPMLFRRPRHHPAVWRDPSYEQEPTQGPQNYPDDENYGN